MEEEIFDQNKNTESLSGTQIRSLKERAELTELDALIEETLKESKILQTNSSPTIEESPLVGTKLSGIYSNPSPKDASPKPLPTQNIEQKNPESEQSSKQVPEKKLDEYDKTFKTYKIGDIIKGKVVSLSQTGALVDINYQTDGFLNAEEISQTQINVGDTIEASIISLSNKEGYVELSVKKANAEKMWNKLYEAFSSKSLLEAKVSSAVGGGLIAEIYGFRSFIPASQVFRQPNQQLSDFVGKTLPVKVIEIDKKQNKIILSHKQGSYELRKKEKENFFEQIQVGQILRGKVSNIKKFGVFVNVNGIEGLIHLNDLSWKRISDPAKVVSIGQELDVFVVGIDKEQKRVSFGLKQLQPTPWDKVPEKYKEGQIVDVKIMRFAKFGVFAELEEGVEGLIHNSELSAKEVRNPLDVVKAGEIVKAKILRIDLQNQKIALSIKQAEMEEQKSQLEQLQNNSSQPKITIGDAIGNSIKEQLSNQNEFPQNS